MPSELPQNYNFFFDSVVLSNFALTGNLDILVNRYGTRSVLTSEDLDELARGISCGYESLRDIIKMVEKNHFSTASLKQKELTSYTELLRTLGSGEASCIICAKFRNGIVVTDDRAARRTCKDHNVPFTGTVGILLALCRETILSQRQADDILSEMVEQGFYSPVNSISALL